MDHIFRIVGVPPLEAKDYIIGLKVANVDRLHSVKQVNMDSNQPCGSGIVHFSLMPDFLFLCALSAKVNVFDNDH